MGKPTKKRVGRPAIRPSLKKSISVTIKFDAGEIARIDQAAAADHDKRANWARRTVLKSADAILAAGVAKTGPRG